MSYPYDGHNDSMAINPIDHSIVTHSDTPMISFALEFLHTRWQGILGQLSDLRLNSLLHLTI
jgi:hypothetical protein